MERKSYFDSLYSYYYELILNMISYLTVNQRLSDTFILFLAVQIYNEFVY